MRTSRMVAPAVLAAALVGGATGAVGLNLDRDPEPERLVIRSVEAPRAAAAQPKRYFVLDGDADPVPVGPVFGRAPRALVGDRNLDGVRDLRITAASGAIATHDGIWQYDGARGRTRLLARIDALMLLGPRDDGRVARLRRVAFGEAGAAGTVAAVPNLYLLGDVASCRTCPSQGRRSVRLQYSSLDARWVVYPGNRRDSWWAIR